MKLTEWLEDWYLLHFSPRRVAEWDLDLPDEFHYTINVPSDAGGTLSTVFLLTLDHLVVVDITTRLENERVADEIVSIRQYPLRRLTHLSRTYHRVTDPKNITGHHVDTSFTLHFEGIGAVEIPQPQRDPHGNYRRFMRAIAQLM